MSVNVLTKIVVAQPRAAVAAYMADPANAPAWVHEVQSVQWHTEPPLLRAGARFAFISHALGRRVACVHEVAEHVPAERLVMRSRNAMFATETIYTWEALGRDSTRVSIRSRAEPRGLGWLVAPFVGSSTRRKLFENLARLKAVLERRNRGVNL